MEKNCSASQLAATRLTPPSKIGDSFQPDCAGRTKPLDEVLDVRITA